VVNVYVYVCVITDEAMKRTHMSNFLMGSCAFALLQSCMSEPVCVCDELN